MRQARDVIWMRQKQEWRKELRVREVELQTLASYIAGSAGNEQGLRDASKIRLVGDEDSEKKVTKVISYEKSQRLFGG